MSPNDVYERAWSGISGLVPGRAARRILDDALRSAKRSAHDVSAGEMVEVLVGPVYRDLKRIVPRSGLKRELGQVVRDLRTIAASPASRSTPLGTAGLELVAPSDVATPLPDMLPGPPVERRASRTTPVPRSVAVRRPRPRPAAGALRVEPERVLLTLAALDGVAGVALFDAAGQPQRVRGDLPEPDAVGRVIAAGGSLLRRHGDLRTVCVGTTRGVLVAVPVPPAWIAVTGAPDLNLGSVYAALRALEEER
jgi:hypothetical protein